MGIKGINEKSAAALQLLRGARDKVNAAGDGSADGVYARIEAARGFRLDNELAAGSVAAIQEHLEKIQAELSGLLGLGDRQAENAGDAQYHLGKASDIFTSTHKETEDAHRMLSGAIGGEAAQEVMGQPGPLHFTEPLADRAKEVYERAKGWSKGAATFRREADRLQGPLSTLIETVGRLSAACAASQVSDRDMHWINVGVFEQTREASSAYDTAIGALETRIEGAGQ
jgi:hypothetical protein